jgi:hypothetical protein
MKKELPFKASELFSWGSSILKVFQDVDCGECPTFGVFWWNIVEVCEGADHAIQEGHCI